MEETQKEIEKINKDATLPLNVTNKMISFGGTSYPIGNIASVSTVEKELIESIDSLWKGGSMLIYSLIIIFLPFLTVIYFDSAISTDFGKIIVPIIITLGILGILGVVISFFKWEKIEDKIYNYYGVQIQTNAGSTDLFYSEDKNFIGKINELIYNILSDLSEAVQYTINIADKQIQDNSIQVINTTNNYTSNFDIKIQQQGLSQKDLEFIYVDFKKSLENLDEQLQEIKNDSAREYLKEIVDEINSVKPNPSKIKKLWTATKGVCEGYETINNLVGIGEKVMKAAMIFV